MQLRIFDGIPGDVPECHGWPAGRRGPAARRGQPPSDDGQRPGVTASGASGASVTIAGQPKVGRRRVTNGRHSVRPGAARRSPGALPHSGSPSALSPRRCTTWCLQQGRICTRLRRRKADMRLCCRMGDTLLLRAVWMQLRPCCTLTRVAPHLVSACVLASLP